MNAIEALSLLRRLGVPVIETADAAVALRQSTSATTRTLTRLGEAGLIRQVRHGTWWIVGDIDPLRLPEWLTAPMPSYVSLQTALHYHGLIEQIPEVVYAVSLSRTQRLRTSAGTFSIHHIAPEVFDGFMVLASGAKMATPEKALFDVAYLSAGRSRLFTRLPELELSRGFRTKAFAQWLRRIPSERSRTITARKLDSFLSARDTQIAT